MRKLVAGNWKMNGVSASVLEIEDMIAGAETLPPGVELAVCPPATIAAMAAEILSGSGVALG